MKNPSTLPVYAVCSESHRDLLERYFLPTFRRTTGEKAALHLREVPQACASGQFQSSGWSDQVRTKIEHALDAARSHPRFVFTDVDIVFLRPWIKALLSRLEDADLACMGEPHFSPAFYVARSSERLLAFYERILNEWGKWPGDGEAMRQSFANSGLRVVILPRKFANPGILGYPIPIQGGRVYCQLPTDACVFHANFCGLHEKAVLLDHLLNQAVPEASSSRFPTGVKRFLIGTKRKSPPSTAEPPAPDKAVQAVHLFPSERPDRPFDRQSMMSRAKFRDILAAVGDRQVKLIVEIGSWLGSSTRWFLETFSPPLRSGEHQQFTEIISIDPWTGSPEHREGASELASRTLSLWEQWSANCWEWRHCITPVRLPSRDGIPAVAGELHRQGRAPDFVYIDGDHTESACYQDIVLSHSHWPSALLLGDDYQLEHPVDSGALPVKAAVDRAARDLNRTLQIGPAGVWWMEPCHQPRDEKSDDRGWDREGIGNPTSTEAGVSDQGLSALIEIPERQKAPIASDRILP